MGRSIRSKRGQELRRIQRKKLETWDKNRIQKLSNALAKTGEHVKYLSGDGTEKALSESQQKILADQLNTVAMETEESTEVKGEEKQLTLNQIIKTGIPKRKKRNTGKYGKGGKRKKGPAPKHIPKVR